tara:strand:+ start:1796 stop:1993 length:198 start_codon:yes stop_codon:yes gene_type:complete
MFEYIIFLICIMGCGYQAYHIGIRAGAEKTITKLHETKIIAFDRKGNITPNPFYLFDTPEEEVDN